MGKDGGLNGALLKDLAGIVVVVGTNQEFVLHSAYFDELRTTYTKTGGTFAMDFQWQAGESPTSYIDEDAGIAHASQTKVWGPYVKVILSATSSNVTITRGGIYGTR
jgi:hypothetical protein